jgi:hypothetical protein
MSPETLGKLFQSFTQAQATTRKYDTAWAGDLQRLAERWAAEIGGTAKEGKGSTSGSPCR